MGSNISLKDSLAHLQSIDDFEEWVRTEFRLELPHAALLVTVGKLYGVGSVPTHRLSVDFPLELIELLKNSAGALDDPLMYGWFKNPKMRYVDIRQIDEFGDQQQWRSVFLKYGFHSVMIHGSLDHSAKRFAIFQICNPFDSGSLDSINLFSSLVAEMALAVWRIVFSNRIGLVGRRELTGHPTLSLTAAELHIVELLAQGLSNKEIARRRGVSDSTIKTQVQRTGAKVGATRRAEIVALALPFLSPLPPQALIDFGE